MIPRTKYILTPPPRNDMHLKLKQKFYQIVLMHFYVTACKILMTWTGLLTCKLEMPLLLNIINTHLLTYFANP